MNDYDMNTPLWKNPKVWIFLIVWFTLVFIAAAA